MAFGPLKNIKTDFHAVGDGAFTTATLSITAGLKVLSATTNLWSAGDVGKLIIIDGGGSAVGGVFYTSIATFNNAQQIVLGDAATSTLTNSVQSLGWGTNDGAAFVAANAFARGQLPLWMDLLIPDGVYMMSISAASDARWCRFIPVLRVTGQNRPILLGVGTLGAFTFPQQATTCPISSRVATVRVGDRGAQLLTPSEYPRFQPGNTYTLSDGTVYTAGTTGILRALDMQGFGDPNSFYWEFVTITGVNTSTGAITFDAPVKNSYLSTFPCYDAGAPFAVDQGGPATLYMLDASWNCTQEFIGLRFWLPSSQINEQCENLIYRNCQWIQNSNSLGPNPSVHRTLTWDGCTFTGCLVEVDKTIQDFSVINGTSGHVLWLQNASVENLHIDSSTMDQLKGTAKKTVVTNSTIANLGLGPTGYGRSDSFTASASNIAQIGPLSVIDKGVDDPANGWSISNGVISRPTYRGPTRWAVPGTVVLFAGQQEAEGSFIVTSLSCDGNCVNAVLSITSGLNALSSTTDLWTSADIGKPIAVGGAGPVVDGSATSLRTTIAGVADAQHITLAANAVTTVPAALQGVTWGTTFIGTTIPGTTWPTLPLDAGFLDVQVHPGPVSFTNCTGCNDAVNLSQGGLRYYSSYSKWTYTGNTLNSAYGPRLWGKVVQINFNVTKAYTGIPPLTMNAFSQFGTGATVNLKTAGLRTITQGGTSGSVSGDSLIAAGTDWYFSGQAVPFPSADISGESSAVWPIVQIEISALSSAGQRSFSCSFQ